MIDIEIRGIKAFIEVIEAKGFSSAAQRLGVSRAAVSQLVKQLEERLGVKLLVRTTRHVSLTEAGKIFFEKTKPAFDQIADASLGLSQLQTTPTGILRVTTSRLAADLYLEPILGDFLAKYPSLKAQINVDDHLTNIVKEQFDVGIRTSGFVEKDMVALNLKPLRLVVCGSPGYFRKHLRPKAISDLVDHNCIGYQERETGRIQKWEFIQGKKNVEIEVRGNLLVNDAHLLRNMAVRGLGLVQIIEDHAKTQISAKELEVVLENHSLSFPGFQIYYPSRKHLPAKVKTFTDFLTEKFQTKR